ncbi:MAG: Uma2 family endonuclease [Jaaginema sp. PMC 1079.18]|nr:Uma2 family endonuclease [Jaaginema sp. PMC 1080.18]MEC4850987.1 Uma2 family endonuclease [Jaaginema sp. PMC 1079.18]MEC4865116.1 Uma2 family endonuclease [Jaaginema sp. PMC 1078.18]
MVAQFQELPSMTVEEYLEWEAKQELRHEYINGEIIAMTGSTIPHNKIALNFYRTLYPHLKARGCDAYVSDVKVQDRQNQCFFYPDLAVTCNEEDLNARNFIEHPSVIIEVLSPSTAAYNRGEKFGYYRRISSLQEYVLVDSEAQRVEVYRRGEGKMWAYFPYEANETIQLPSIEFECEIATLYEGVNWEENA